MALWRLRAAVPWITRMGAILGHLLVPSPAPGHLTWPFLARFPRAAHTPRTPFPRRPSEYVNGSERGHGAHVGIRTRDLFLTKEVLYRLSYVGEFNRMG